MSEGFKNSFRIASIYIGAVIGAGFASGQEILQFFTVFHGKGLTGIILAGVLFFVITTAVMDSVYRYKYKNYTEFIMPLMGKYSGILTEVMVMVFLLCSFFIMITGAGALFEEYFSIPAVVGAGIMSLACCFAFLFNIRGVVAINTVVAPILVGGILFLGLFIMHTLNVSSLNGGNEVELSGNWLTSSVIYVSYNSIILITIVSSLLPYLTSRKVVFAGAAVGSIFLCISAVIIYTLTNLFYPEIVNCQIPLLMIVENLGLHAAGLCFVILFAAMFTSAISAGFGFLNRISGGSVQRLYVYTIIICFLAVPLSTFGFGKLIKGIYPLFGYLGLFQILVIVISYLWTVGYAVCRKLCR